MRNERGKEAPKRSHSLALAAVATTPQILNLKSHPEAQISVHPDSSASPCAGELAELLAHAALPR
eukprot:462134-Rhodomonas_salina.1